MAACLIHGVLLATVTTFLADTVRLTFYQEAGFNKRTSQGMACVDFYSV